MRERFRISCVTTVLVHIALLGLFGAPGVAAPAVPGLAVHAAPAAPPASLPILGVDALAKGTVVESLQDVLAHWVERGFSGAVLLHIDAGVGLHTVATENIAALAGLAGRRDLEGLTKAGRSGAGRLFDAGNVVRVAAGLGIVREVVWITPFPFPEEDDAGRKLKDYLGDAGFSARDSDTFSPADGCLRGRAGDLPVLLCNQERLPMITDPVLLSVDAEYIPYAADRRGITFLTEMRALFSSLRAARYAVLDAVVAHSVLEGNLPPDLRWVGEMVVHILQNPGVVLVDNPPERWNALQMLATMGTSGQEKEMEMLGVALSQLEKQPHDPALLLYAAEASAGHGGGERAQAYAEEACRKDRGYCVGLRELGLRFIERGDAETGLRLIAAGEKLLPGMEYGQLNLGIALMKVGKAAEALEVLENVRERRGDFPSRFLIGATQLFTGDRAAARLSFDAALAAIGRLTEIQVTRSEIAQAVAIAGAFYREEGLMQKAEQLEQDARLRLPAPEVRPEQGAE